MGPKNMLWFKVCFYLVLLAFGLRLEAVGESSEATRTLEVVGGQLEIHEFPGMGPNSTDTLKAGHVVTVEPGLYYTELGGGVRLEDMALITGNGTRNLTKFEKHLEI